MGCRCCRMIKSYIYDPSVTDVSKTDSVDNAVYQAHHLSGGPPGRHSSGGPNKQKQGFHNLGYSKSSESNLKFEVEKNQVNHRLHAAPPPTRELHHHSSAPSPEGGLYIIQPDSLGPQWVMHNRGPSQVPVYPTVQEYETRRSYTPPHLTAGKGWESPIRETANESLSADEVDEGVGGTPEYPCDTGDEGSILSVDIHTSTTSLSSAGTRDDHRLPKNPDHGTLESGICVTKSEDEDEMKMEEEEVESITESMVAEALAALEAATAGEDLE
ncbi:uncharacterized protein zgc:194930 [Synchiropus splendidus]|uniref:uncharacterized protein zgc:194930 n=1 Tax=Synchiropus splendidus TaxID=270530 RepID=UPI00237E7EF1|nr:uncharacterized protein zgc:194930 [Synchiropus splendidus]